MRVRVPGVDVHEVSQAHRLYLVELMQQWTRLKDGEARTNLVLALAWTPSCSGSTRSPGSRSSDPALGPGGPGGPGCPSHAKAGFGILGTRQAEGADDDIFSRHGGSPWQLLLVLIGFVIMVISLLPGAQFWFGLLTKLGSLRAAGPKPAAAAS